MTDGETMTLRDYECHYSVSRVVADCKARSDSSISLLSPGDLNRAYSRLCVSNIAAPCVFSI
jgi:hypothetical protein